MKIASFNNPTIGAVSSHPDLRIVDCGGTNRIDNAILQSRP